MDAHRRRRLIGHSPATSLFLMLPIVLLSAVPLLSQESPSPLFLDTGQTLGDTRTFLLVPGDLDGDGDQDLVHVDFLGPSQVWINDGEGHFETDGQLLGGEGGHGAALADLDGDGDLDLFLVHNGDTDRIFPNDGRGIFRDTGQQLGGEEAWETKSG